MPSVPLSRASPSFASRRIGDSPAAASAGPASVRRPSRSSTHPLPSRTMAAWARGARSPDAPSDPISGTAGVIPAFRRSTIARTSRGRAPDVPAARVRALSTCIARTTSRSTSAPMPAAWLWTRAYCTWATCSTGTRVDARAPKPVVTP